MATELPGAPPQTAFQMRVTLGGMYAKRGRRADALRELDAAGRLGAQRADLHSLRGLVLDALARPAEAVEAFRAAWNLERSDPVKAYQALRPNVTSARTEDLQPALAASSEAYRRLVRDGASANASPFVGIELLQGGAADTPVVSHVVYAQGYAHLAHGKYDEAIAEFRRASAIDPLVTDPAARSASMMQAVAALRQGRVADARVLLEGATALQDSSEAHRVLGLTYWADSQDDKSIEQLEIAIRGNPRDERSRLALARVLTSAGRDSDAERALRETIDALPDSALARWWLGSGYERLNRFADARREFELASAGAVAGRSWFYASIGRLAGDAADVPGAIAAFARAVSANPNDPIMHKYLAGALRQQDRADEAFVELVAALLIDPLDADAHAGVGQIHLDAGRYDQAVTALRRAVELSAHFTEARYALATALMRLGNTAEAAPELERVEQAQRQSLASRRRNMSLDVLKEEAALRAAEGRYETAIALYENALALGADPVVYRQIAELYAKVGRINDAARARARYDRALQGGPTILGTPR